MIAVDIKVSLLIDAEDPTDELHDAVKALADVMLVQAEDGLYTTGNEDSGSLWERVDGQWVERENEHLADFVRTDVSVGPLRRFTTIAESPTS